MLSQELQAKINDLWSIFRSAGISNPLVILENISYLMLLKYQETAVVESAGRAKKGSSKSGIKKVKSLWSELVQKPQTERLPFFKENIFRSLTRSSVNGPDFPAAMKGAVFGVSRPAVFARAVELIDELIPEGAPPEHPGEVYEALLAELHLAGKNDQFRTPRHLVRTMVELVEPALGEWVCDPAAGTGGLLIGVYKWILEEHTPPGDIVADPKGSRLNLTTGAAANRAGKKTLLEGQHFSAFDVDATMTRIGLTNMLLHGIRRPSFRCADMLVQTARTPRRFDIVISDLPKGTSHEALFVRRCRSLLKNGGRAALVVSEELLFNEAEEARSLRKQLVESDDLEAVVSLPGGVFLPYSLSKTAILLLNRGKADERVNFYEVTADGFTQDNERRPDPAKNDLRFVPQAHRILAKGNPRQEHWASSEAQSFAVQQCFRVERERIAQNNFTLAASPYRQQAAKASSLQSPRQIVGQIRRLQEQFGKSLDKIEKLVNEVAGA